jgi:hypothetical protein
LFSLSGGVGEYALLTEPDELRQAALFNLSLGGESQLLLYVYFDPEALAVESLLPAKLVSK